MTDDSNTSKSVDGATAKPACDLIDFRNYNFGTGKHLTPDDGMCVMEAVAYVAGEPHTDRPKCASPVISAFLRFWNDSITDDDNRRDLLGPFVYRMVGTAASREIESQRSWMAFDWLVRNCLPSFMELTPMTPIAKKLRDLPELTTNTLHVAEPVTERAYNAAWNARGSAAAGNATGNAAGNAAASTAYNAATYDTALHTVAYAAHVAALHAASTAANNDVALEPTVKTLQQSACGLVDRMIKLSEKNELVQMPDTALVQATNELRRH